MVTIKLDPSTGYIKEYAPKHPRARERDSFVHQHILVAEKALGYFLPKKAVVHHHDLDKTNNQNTNLVICEDDNYHKLLHKRMEVLRAGGDPNIQKFCDKCKQLKDLGYFLSRSSSLDGLRSECLACERVRSREYQRVKRERRNPTLGS